MPIATVVYVQSKDTSKIFSIQYILITLHRKSFTPLTPAWLTFLTLVCIRVSPSSFSELIWVLHLRRYLEESHRSLRNYVYNHGKNFSTYYSIFWWIPFRFFLAHRNTGEMYVRQRSLFWMVTGNFRYIRLDGSKW